MDAANINHSTGPHVKPETPLTVRLLDSDSSLASTFA
jgi:hypothetical protein